ncbi:MAG: cytidylate kinase-like family protein [Planctomycetes bacterium]|nr:cytidylate kinase-like family protein [Planctomycetota bacterium]
MVPGTGSERLVEGLTRAVGYSPARSQARERAKLAVAISREVGALGTTVAREVGARLGWTVYDHEILEKMARETGHDVAVLEKADERRSSWLSELAEAFAAVPVVSESAYAHHLLEALFSIASRGECVLVGRGAAQILPPASTLRVRLVADLEDRIRVMGERLGLSRDEAARHVDATDRERALFVRRHFQRDPEDLHAYDLVLNTSRLRVADCADLIERALRALERRQAVA